jgi:hypothetical protein
MRKLFVLIAAAVFVVCSSVPVLAQAEWDFFGNVMFRTMVYDQDKEALAGYNFDDWDLNWGRHCDVAFGASVKAGDIGGFLMYRPVEAGFTHNGDLAQFYGTWDYGPGVLTIGKALGPVYWFPSKQVFLDNQGLVGFGGLFSYFKPLIQSAWSGEWGELKVALMEPQTSITVTPRGANPTFQNSTSNPWANDASYPAPQAPQGSSYVLNSRISGTGGAVTAPSAAGYETDMELPKIEASYEKDFGQFGFKVMGGYQSYPEVDIATDKDYKVTSWVVGAGWKSNFGPFYFNGTVHAAQNSGAYQLEWQQANGNPAYDTDTDEIIDNESWGFNAAAGWTFNDMFGIEVGYGRVECELDGDPVGLAETEDTQVYYINATINLAKGFTITPEVGISDWGENFAGADEGKTTYYGARWQITF